MSAGSASFSTSATNYGRLAVDSYYALSGQDVHNGPFTITGDLTVNGTTDLKGPVTCESSLAVADTMTVGGLVSLAAGLNVGGALTVGGATTLAGLVSALPYGSFNLYQSGPSLVPGTGIYQTMVSLDIAGFRVQFGNAAGNVGGGAYTVLTLQPVKAATVGPPFFHQSFTSEFRAGVIVPVASATQDAATLITNPLTQVAFGTTSAGPGVGYVSVSYMCIGLVP